jgi:ADP-ribose pyrophosphatase
MKFKLLGSRTVYSGRAFTIRQDILLTPDGRKAGFDIVDHVGSVVILPLDSNGDVVFVRQYRHAAGLDLLELPAGTLEKDESFETCASREIREEIGMAAGKMELLGSFYLAPGYSTEYMHVFLATDLKDAPLKADADEFITIERIPSAMALTMCESGKISDAKSLAAILLARSHLENDK